MSIYTDAPGLNPGVGAPSRKERWALLAVLILGFALRLFRLGSGSLWYDETVSVYLARLPLREMLARTAGDIHPPGYYALLHAWQAIASPTVAHGIEFGYGWVSVFFGMLVIALVVPIGTQLLGRREALFAALLLAINPFQLWYSQEVRMYSLGAALALLCLWFMLRFWKTGRWRYLLFYALSGALGLYVLTYFVFWLAALGLIGLARAGSGRRAGQWMLAQVGILLLYLPWLPTTVRQVTDPPVPPWREAWTGAADVARAASEALSTLVVGHTPWGPNALWALMAALLALLFIVYGRGTRADRWSLLTAVLLPITLIFSVSLVGPPIYHARYIYLTAAPFALVAAGATVGVGDRSRLLGWVLGLLLIASSVAGLVQLWTNPAYRTDDHRAAVARLAQQWRPGDVIFANAGWITPILQIYWPEQTGDLGSPPRLAPSLRLLDVATGTQLPEVSVFDLSAGVPLVRSGSVDGAASLGWGNPASDFFAISAQDSTAAIDRLAHGYQRLWHYRLYDTVSDPNGRLRAWLDANAPIIQDEAIPGRDFGRLELRALKDVEEASPSASDMQLGEALLLTETSIPALAPAGATLYVGMTWQTLDGLQSLPVGLSLSLRLMDKAGVQVAQHDEALQPSTLDWRAGEQRSTVAALGVPSHLPAGDYALEAVVYRQDDASSLVSPRAEAGRVSLGNVHVE
jgi:hypothetical protein